MSHTLTVGNEVQALAQKCSDLEALSKELQGQYLRALEAKRNVQRSMFLTDKHCTEFLHGDTPNYEGDKLSLYNATRSCMDARDRYDRALEKFYGTRGQLSFALIAAARDQLVTR